MSDRTQVAVGIDLGTTRSAIAFLDSTARPITIENSEGNLITPSVVFFDGDTPIVGHEAVEAAEFEPDRVAVLAKREVGKLTASMTVGGSSVPPEVVQALVLRKLKQDADLKLGTVRDVVITVPAHFNEPRRKATQDAGRLAGLNVIDIINEPTAAALAYGIQRGLITRDGRVEQDESILVYDLGGGTFDVALMDITGRHFETVATAGDVHLGGCDWDRIVANHIAVQWQGEHGSTLLGCKAAEQKLLATAERAKFALTARESVPIRFHHDGRQLKIELTRDEFEQMTAPLVDRTIRTTRRVLQDAGRDWSDISRLLLVGGSTRMPMIHERLSAESRLPVDRSLSPDESVAHGAAVYAGILRRNPAVRQLSVSNVNSHDLGVLGTDPISNTTRRAMMIARNSVLPARAAKLFHTSQDNQQSVLVRVVEGGDALGNNATVIGNCIVQNLPPRLPKQTPVEVRFHYGTDGRLNVVAKLKNNVADATLVIDRESGLTNDELQEWQQRIQDNRVLAGPADPIRIDPQADAKRQPPVMEPLEVSGGPGKSSPAGSAPPVFSAAEDGEAEVTDENAFWAAAKTPESEHGLPSSPTCLNGQHLRVDRDQGKYREPVRNTSAQRRKTRKLHRTGSRADDREAEPSTPARNVQNGTARNGSSTELVERELFVVDRRSSKQQRWDASRFVLGTAYPAGGLCLEDNVECTDLKAADVKVEAEDEELKKEPTGLARFIPGQHSRRMLFTNGFVHLVVALIFALIVLPASPAEFSLDAAIVDSTVFDEIVVHEVDVEPDLAVPEAVAEELVEDLVSVVDENIELDPGLPEPEVSAAIPEPEAAAPAPVLADRAAASRSQGEFGGRTAANRKEKLRKFGGTPASEAAVLAGLRWLKKHQKYDGSWSFDHRGRGCDCTFHGSATTCDMGATGMALMAFLGAGHTPHEGEFKDNVRRGVLYLVRNAQKRGNGVDLRGASANDVGLQSGGMYVHGIATTALCEALGMNKASYRTSMDPRRKFDQRVRPVAEGAIRFIINAQNNQNGSWGYTPGSSGDTSIVGWQTMALASGSHIKIPVPTRVERNITRFLDLVESDYGSKYGYSDRRPRASTTSIGLLCRMLLGWPRSDPRLRAGVEYLSAIGPASNSMYYNYYATQVLHQYGGEHWKKWNAVMRDHLVNTQAKGGHADGSWAPADAHGQAAGGRLYMTCLAVMTLEVYYRHMPIYKEGAMLETQVGAADGDKP